MVSIKLKIMSSRCNIVGFVVLFSGSGNLFGGNKYSRGTLFPEQCLPLSVKYLTPSLECGAVPLGNKLLAVL